MVHVKLSFEKSCRDRARTSKQDHVISKLGMVYIFYSTGNAKPKKLIILLAAIKLETENRGLDNIEHGRERAALMESTGGFEEVSSASIY